MSQRVKIVLLVLALSFGLWQTSIPQGIWYARTAYINSTIAAQIKAVKEENDRLKKLLEVPKQEAPVQTPSPTPAPEPAKKK